MKINGILISGDVPNPRTLASGNGNIVTGIPNGISASVLIPAGTMQTDNTLVVRNLLVKTAGTVSVNGRIFINTSSSLTGATTLATSGPMAGSTQYFQHFYRDFYFDGTSLYVYNPTNTISSDITSGTLNLVTFNPLIDNYLLFVANGSAGLDNLRHKRYIVQIYD